MLRRFDSTVATASIPQRSQVQYNPYRLFSPLYCTVSVDLASHVYPGRRRRSYVSSESRQYKQTNKQINKQARRVDVNTSFEAKPCTDWIPSIFHTIDWPWRSVGLPLKKRHVEINAMFLHDQIRRVPQHYSIGIFCTEPVSNLRTSWIDYGWGAGLCGRARVNVAVAIGRKIHKAGNSFKYIRPFRRGRRQTRPRHEPNTSRPHTQQANLQMGKVKTKTL